MKLIFENIGKIKKAEVEIGGLTIIAGENDTGKSTIGKTLFSIIQGAYNITDNKEKSSGQLNIIKGKVRTFLINEFKDDLLNKQSTRGFIDINDIVISFTKDEYKAFNIEINNQNFSNLKPYNTPNGITLIDTPLILGLSNRENCLYTDYLDNSRKEIEKEKLNEIKKNVIIGHQWNLLSKLEIGASKNIMENDDYIKILKKIRNIIGGTFYFNSKTWDYEFFKDDNKKFSSWNVASGIKSFAILEMLIRSERFLSPKRPLIIDEPEVHIHPEWQIKYAEIIVELVKNDIPVVLTTHSENFLQGLMDLVRENQELINKTSICYAKRDGDSAIIESGAYDVEKNEELLKKIYDSLSAPAWRVINDN